MIHFILREHKENLYLKGMKETVGIISSDLTFVEWHVLFTSFPSQAKIDEKFANYFLKSKANKYNKCVMVLKCKGL